jgi:hypothetical protein
MYKSLGLGWGNSILGFIALAMVPIPIFSGNMGRGFGQARHLTLSFEFSGHDSQG